MKDILLDAHEDLQLHSGDWKLGDAQTQHQQLLLLSSPGDYKEFPDVGVAALSYSDDETKQNLIRHISQSFTKDGMQVDAISIDAQGIINIAAQY